MREAFVERRCLPLIGLPHQGQVVPTKPLEASSRVVRGPVVDTDDLDRPPGLCSDRGYRFLDPGGRVEARDDDRDEGMAPAIHAGPSRVRKFGLNKRIAYSRTWRARWGLIRQSQRN